MPLQRRVPKRGFRRLLANEARRQQTAALNLAKLARLSEEVTEVTPQVLLEAGLIAAGRRVKILGEGEIHRALTVNAHAFSRSAREKILAAGGNAIVIGAN
jgi:large subunit ribosomal protein L15